MYIQENPPIYIYIYLYKETRRPLPTPSLPRGQLLQTVLIPVEDIRVPAKRILVRVLPDGVVRPAARRTSGGARIPRQDQRTGTREGTAVAGARLPPVGGGVEHGVPARLAAVGVDEVLDPRDHLRVGQAVAGVARRVVLEVEHAGQGDAVVGPAAAVGEEVLGLVGARGAVRVGEVVAAADEAGRGGAGVVLREGGVDVGGALGGLGLR